MPPSKIEVVDESRTPIENGTMLGPFKEGDHLKSTCLVLGTRPIPLVDWYRGDEKLKGKFLKYCSDDDDGIT